MSILALTLLVAARVSADQQEFSVANDRNPTEERSGMARKLANSDVEVIERSMAEFMEKLRTVVHKKPALDTEQQNKLEKSLESFKRKTVDHVEPRVLSVEEVNMESGSARNLYQEDIILSEKQKEEILSIIGSGRSKRQAYINESTTDNGKWATRVVSYKFDDDDPLSKRGRTAFKKAAKLWMRNTCINIIEQVDEEDDDEDEEGDEEEEEDDERMEDEEREQDGEERMHDGDNYYDYEDNEYSVSSYEDLKYTELEDLRFDTITVRSGNYCGSSVGRQFHGAQAITLGRKCETIGTAAHELGHALGFWHTHVRHDRDEYVTVNWPNIDANYTSEFVIQTNKSNVNYGLPYDYGSVMHYRTTSASTNGEPTLVPKDGLYTQTLGSLIVSFYDLLMMNMHYNCTDICKNSTQAECKNGGFAHPRNCSKCICPSGYGGNLCDERPTKCGEELIVTSNWTQLVTANSSDLEAGSEDGYKRCVYWLRAPNGSNIEVRLTKLPENVSADGCIYAGVEIKTREDQRLTGYRFCSKDDVNTTLISNSSTVPVMTYMRRRRNDTVTELEYRIAKGNGGDGISENMKT